MHVCQIFHVASRVAACLQARQPPILRGSGTLPLIRPIKGGVRRAPQVPGRGALAGLTCRMLHVARYMLKECVPRAVVHLA